MNNQALNSSHHKRPRKLRIKNKAKGFDALPFVSYRSDTPCWNAPATGGYHGGYETGSSMALAFMKHLRDSDDSFDPCEITSIVKSFMISWERAGGKAADDVTPMSAKSEAIESLRGQYVGFFNTLSPWLTEAAKSLGSRLDKVSNQQLLSAANDGICFDQKAFEQSVKLEEAKS